MGLWIPQTAEEIERLVHSKAITESASLDGKRELGNGRDIAKDVAAMANDGGVLLYGVGEDTDKRLTELHPFPLAGAEERVRAIVASGLHGAVQMQVLALYRRKTTDGYLLVVVPASLSAPHMVVHGGYRRFVGRSGTITVDLDGGEVDRLMDRRNRWLVDDTELMKSASSVVLNEATSDHALVVLAHPQGTDPHSLARAAGVNSIPDYLTSVFVQVVEAQEPRRHSWLSTITQLARSRWSPQGHSWAVVDPIVDSTVDSYLRGEIEVSDKLALRLRTGGAGGRTTGGQNLLDEDLITQRALVALSAAGRLCVDAGYLGSVSVGVFIEDTLDAKSLLLDQGHLFSHGRNRNSYRHPTYYEATRVLSSDLHTDAGRIAKGLLEPLFIVLTDGGFAQGTGPLD